MVEICVDSRFKPETDPYIEDNQFEIIYNEAT